jgi:hypothetical protein
MIHQKIKVYDDLIPDYLRDFFELSCLGLKGEEFIHPTVPFKCKYESTATEDNEAPLSFVHVLKSPASGVSPFLENFSMIPNAVCNSNSIVMKDILLARLYITVPHKTNLTHYKPHTDLSNKHLVVLYYINDADGATVFFDEHNNIIKEVEPKRGRVVLFDGSIKHSGGIPKDGPRCIANFDIYI